MGICKDCGGEVDPMELVRYDVLNPAYDPQTQPMDPTVGPYCGGCFPSTTTGAYVASLEA